MKVVSTLLICLMILATSVSDATEAADDVARAIEDANVDVRLMRQGAWFTAGCLLGVLGILLAYFITPIPPTERFIGKSAEYVHAYTNEFIRVSQRSRIRAASQGCATNALVSAGVYAILLLVNNE